MNFEWDDGKEALNLRWHDISFHDAALVFLDPGRVESYDGREDYGEDRWLCMGFAYATLLTVAYTIRNDETIRIISARKAVRHEQEKYSEANPRPE